MEKGGGANGILFRSINEKTPLKFTYSAFHGIGYHYSKRMMREYGFPEDKFFSVTVSNQLLLS